MGAIAPVVHRFRHTSLYTIEGILLPLFSPMPSQWENLFKNVGTWNGSFTRLNLDGAIVSDTPSCLVLEQTSEESAHLNLTRYPEGKPPLVQNMAFTSLMPGLIFCEDGSFTQGSLQWSPGAQFGAEFGLTLPNARLRLVQMYDNGTDLSYLALIRETRDGQDKFVLPDLTIEQLLGTWRGQAITYAPDGKTSAPFATEIQIEQDGRDRVTQTLQYGEQTLQSSAQLDGSRLLFEQGDIPYQLLLLPQGCSALCPQKISQVSALVCEVGWLINPTTRLRLVRQYKPDGSWMGQTWIREEKVVNP